MSASHLSDDAGACPVLWTLQKANPIESCAVAIKPAQRTWALSDFHLNPNGLRFSRCSFSHWARGIGGRQTREPGESFKKRLTRSLRAERVKMKPSQPRSFFFDGSLLSVAVSILRCSLDNSFLPYLLLILRGASFFASLPPAPSRARPFLPFASSVYRLILAWTPYKGKGIYYRLRGVFLLPSKILQTVQITQRNFKSLVKGTLSPPSGR